MTLLNQVGVETRWGFRTIELYRGDLTRLDDHVDVLVISCFRGSYHPTTGTVVAALRDCGVDVEACAAAPALDLRQPFGTRSAEPLRDGPADRVLCAELRTLWGRVQGAAESPLAAFEDVFVTLSTFEARGGSARCVAMPALGAGSQGLDAAAVADALVRSAPAYLRRSATTERLLFVEIDGARADALGHAVDAALKRSDVSLPQSDFVEGVRREVQETVLSLEPLEGRLAQDIAAVLSRDHVRSFELGVVGRRVAERVVADLGVGGTRDLASGIEGLAGVGVASWIRSYLHVLRVLGNESAHERDRPGQTPAHVEARDVAIGLFCLQRVLEFWASQRGRVA